MKTAKKVFAILTALTLIYCVFVGCDSNETPDTTENNSANATQAQRFTKSVLFSLLNT